ncbi:unnamed protein product [Schistosoma margrebowiei]|uniref:Uncharacterized protein n=1 Tax=Schistosoma margrebowiei TaxID=48269 RepID=A0A3P8DPM5_9TREM|nr:unnamed protein product [Schistosoma margrebowiei]
MSLFGWGIINRHKLPVVVSWILLSSFTVFTTMNFVLFYRVIIAERRILQFNHYKLSINGVMK